MNDHLFEEYQSHPSNKPSDYRSNQNPKQKSDKPRENNVVSLIYLSVNSS